MLPVVKDEGRLPLLARVDFSLPPKNVSKVVELCGVGELSGKPFLFVGHGAEISEGGVQARVVVICGPRHDFVTRRAARSEIMAMKAFALERAEQALGTALSQQSPFRLIDARIAKVLSCLAKAMLAYWLPRSEWRSVPAPACGGTTPCAMHPPPVARPCVPPERSRPLGG